MAREAVWITGVGACSALGMGAIALADALEQGHSGVRLHAGEPKRGLAPYAAADVTDPLGQHLPPGQRNLYDRHSLLALTDSAVLLTVAKLP